MDWQRYGQAEEVQASSEGEMRGVKRTRPAGKAKERATEGKANMGRLVGCGNFETPEGLRTDSPAGDVGSHNIVCSWCAQAHVSIHACDFTN